MKSLKLIFFSVVGCGVLKADSPWTISLVQRQLDTGSLFQSYVDEHGEELSAAAVPEGGAEFQLWAFKRENGIFEELLLDTEVVGTYMPTGELKIITPDPYDGPIPRTRIDQGFTVQHTVGGLVASSSSTDAPLAARQILLTHQVASYEPGANWETAPEYGSLLPAEDFNQLSIQQNGTDELRFAAGNIPGNDPYRDAGLETFQLFALPDGEIAQLQLDEAQVQIWPLSKGEIKGIDEDQTYTLIPTVEVELMNLYPDSKTWMQIYKGPPSPGTEGVRLEESTIVVNDLKPRNSRLVFRELQKVFTDGGPWTLEVLTETPFGVEILDTVQLNILKDLKIRGALLSLGDE